MQTTDANRIRRRLGHAIALAIGDYQKQYGDHHIDIDEWTEIAAMMLPMTRIEAQAEMDEILASSEGGPPVSTGPGLLAEIRELLHADDLSLKCTLEAAANAIRERNAAPGWHDRPTGPGKWMDEWGDTFDVEQQSECDGWDKDSSNRKRGRVVGPIPTDTKGQDG